MIRLTIVAALLALCFALSPTPEASAFGHRHGCRASAGCSGRVGFFARRAARRQAAYGCSGAAAGCSGDYGCSGAAADCSGSAASCSGTTVEVIEEVVPATPATPTAMPRAATIR
jgi:hypothetical protein